MDDDLVTGFDGLALVIRVAFDAAAVNHAVGRRPVLERRICARHKVPPTISASWSCIHELPDALAVGREFRGSPFREQCHSPPMQLGVAQILDFFDADGL
jgi:hypothetical protein